MEINKKLVEQMTNRRTFMKGSGAVLGAGTIAAIAPNVHAQGSDVIRVGLIGCGGRGGVERDSAGSRRTHSTPAFWCQAA